MNIQTKYNIDDKVYRLEDRKIREYSIRGFEISKTDRNSTINIWYKIFCDLPYTEKIVNENDIFPTKEAVIEDLMKDS